MAYHRTSIILFCLGIPSVALGQTIVTVAGTGERSYTGDGGPATLATFARPRSVFVDRFGNLFISERDFNVVRKIDAETGLISTVAGDGFFDDFFRGRYNGDGESATRSSLYIPEGIFVDTQGHLYIAERGNDRIRRVDAVTGTISTVAGNGEEGYSGDGGFATDARLHDPTGVWLDRQGNIYIADLENHRVRKVDATTGVITTAVGTGEPGFSGDQGPATEALLRHPIAVFVDRFGCLYLNDAGNRRVRKVEPSGQIITVSGGGSEARGDFFGDGGPATLARTFGGKDIFVDAAGNLFITDENNNRIRRVDASGIITTVAGNGNRGFSGDSGLATEAALNDPKGVFVDDSGNLFIVDEDNHRVRMIAGIGAPTTVASYQVANLDYDKDGIIGFSDFLLFSAQFGKSESDREYTTGFDFDGNGRVGFNDFLFFADAFGLIILR